MTTHPINFSQTKISNILAQLVIFSKSLRINLLEKKDEEINGLGEEISLAILDLNELMGELGNRALNDSNIILLNQFKVAHEINQVLIKDFQKITENVFKSIQSNAQDPTYNNRGKLEKHQNQLYSVTA